MTSTARPTVVVAFDLGSAGPMEIIRAARGMCDLVFALDTSLPTCAAVASSLRRVATVCDVTGLSGAEAADVLGRRRPAGIVTFSDSRIAFAAAVAERLGLAWHSPAIAAILRDKFRQRQAMARAGLSVPGVRLVRSVGELMAAAARAPGPVVVKPVVSMGSVDTFLVRSCIDQAVLAHVGTRFARGDAFVVEDLLVGDELVAGDGFGDYVSVETAFSQGRAVHLAITGKLPFVPPFREAGALYPHTLGPADAARVVAEADAALRAVGVTTGVAHTEIKLTSAGPRVIEVNGRLGGHVDTVISRAGGGSLLATTLRLHAFPDAPIQPVVLARPPRVGFQYFVVLPDAAGVFTGLRGTSQALAIGGVENVELVKRPGEAFSVGAGALAIVAKVTGSVPDHEALRQLVGYLGRVLVADFSLASAGG